MELERIRWNIRNCCHFISDGNILSTNVQKRHIERDCSLGVWFKLNREKCEFGAVALEGRGGPPAREISEDILEFTAVVTRRGNGDSSVQEKRESQCNLRRGSDGGEKEDDIPFAGDGETTRRRLGGLW
jgi:hypothetical protein